MCYDSLEVLIKDSVYYDPLETFVNVTNTELDITLDVDAIFKNNLAVFKTKIDDDDNIESFISDSAIRSLMYFGAFDALLSRYESKFERVSDNIEEPDTMLPTKVELIQDYSVIPVAYKHSGGGGSRTITPGFKEESALSKRNKKKIGALGEKVVFNMLNKMYSSVVWKSENAVDSGDNIMGSAGFGYDIQYVDDKGRLVYVEVKSTSSKDNTISFSMSDREYDFALKNIDSYQLYFVSDVKGSPRVFLLKDLFKDGAFNTEKFFVETDINYEVNANANPVSKVEVDI